MHKKMFLRIILLFFYLNYFVLCERKFNENFTKRYFWLTTTTKKIPDFYCADKEDDGLYENEDCKKYWHCLYVGTIFQSAVERKCPIGTMFHPLMGQCEISTVLTCKQWRKYVYGPGYIDPSETTAEPITTTTTEIITTTTTTIPPTTTTTTTTTSTTATTTTTTSTTTTTTIDDDVESTKLLKEKIQNRNQIEKLKSKFLKNLLTNLSNAGVKKLDTLSNEPHLKLLLERLNSSKARVAEQTSSTVKASFIERLKTNLTADNSTSSKNFTLLTATGKKTVIVPVNQTVTEENLRNLFVYLASKDVNTTTSNITTNPTLNFTTTVASEEEIIYINDTLTESVEEHQKNDAVKTIESLNDIANLFEVSGAPSNSIKKSVIENDDDSLVFEQDDISSMDTDFLLDNLKLENQSGNNDEEVHMEDDTTENIKPERTLKLQLTSSIASSASSILIKSKIHFLGFFSVLVKLMQMS